MADKVVELEFAESISLETGAPDTQKNELKPWKKKEWCIPKVSGEFVARVHGATCWTCLPTGGTIRSRLVVCFDEDLRGQFPTGEVRPPIEAAPGRVARYGHRSTSETGPGTCS